MNTPPSSPTFAALRRFYDLPFVGMCALAPDGRIENVPATVDHRTQLKYSDPIPRTA
jgi:hypothetical protein